MSSHSRRRKIIHEFYETERAYVDGLQLVYSHFLTPLIHSLDTPQPLLDRAQFTALFSNFIDIWNLHTSFFSSLSLLLHPDDDPLPPLSPILLSHFPYLSLYTPFITAFPDALSFLSTVSSSPAHSRFAAFLAVQEAHPQCARLPLRDWLLTIVQRCPRYLLLLTDLIQSTPEGAEKINLQRVHNLLSKITASLNTSLHTHAQTLALLALQRATHALPPSLTFVTPGRVLLRRAPLLLREQGRPPVIREFLLFSDVLVWLARVGGEDRWVGESPWAHSDSDRDESEFDADIAIATPTPTGSRPSLLRSRSKSEAELATLKAHTSHQHGRPRPASAAIFASDDASQKWVYKGQAALVDLEVVVSAARGVERKSVWGRSGSAEREGTRDEWRFDVLSPEVSFAVYAASRQDRDSWTTALRSAKSTLLTSLHATHPHSTLTSSTSSAHVRRALHAVAERPIPLRMGRDESSSSGASSTNTGTSLSTPARAHVEHFLPPVWIPDDRTTSCMRCGRPFGMFGFGFGSSGPSGSRTALGAESTTSRTSWWRGLGADLGARLSGGAGGGSAGRRHHCRLCGRCVCGACSGRTFYITDPSNPADPGKPARACDACYETVFPLLDPPSTNVTQNTNPDTSTSTLSSFPTWMTVRAGAAGVSAAATGTYTSTSASPHPLPSPPFAETQLDALMAIRSAAGVSFSAASGVDHTHLNSNVNARRVRPRLRSAARPRSYHQILEDFQDLGSGGSGSGVDKGEDRGRSVHDHDHGDRVEGSVKDPSGEDTEEQVEAAEGVEETDEAGVGTADTTDNPTDNTDDRRRKRLSLPAVMALQTTSVTARAGVVGEGRARRFSLVLGGAVGKGKRKGGAVGTSDGGAGGEGGKEGGELSNGAAAGKLIELLRKRKE